MDMLQHWLGSFVAQQLAATAAWADGAPSGGAPSGEQHRGMSVRREGDDVLRITPSPAALRGFRKIVQIKEVGEPPVELGPLLPLTVLVFAPCVSH